MGGGFRPPFVAVQRNALHDYSGLIEVGSVPSSVAALMLFEGTLCTVTKDTMRVGFRVTASTCLLLYSVALAVIEEAFV